MGHDFGRTWLRRFDHRRVNRCVFQLSAYLHRRMASVGAVQKQFKLLADGRTSAFHPAVHGMRFCPRQNPHGDQAQTKGNKRDTQQKGATKGTPTFAELNKRDTNKRDTHICWAGAANHDLSPLSSDPQTPCIAVDRDELPLALSGRHGPRSDCPYSRGTH